MGLLGFLWDAYQQSEISATRDDVRRAESTANSADLRIGRLQAQVEHLSLVNMALWSIVRDRMGLSEQDLADRVRDIDLSDGKLDGKVAGETRACPTCGRTMSARHRHCIYCGIESV